MDIVKFILLLLGGFVLLVKGADFFVDGASAIAKRFGIPELVIGLTIVAMGTSAPEAAVSIQGALKGDGGADISIGNVLGSNIINTMVILGLAAAIVAIKVGKSTIRIEMPFLIGITVIFIVMGLDGQINRIDGAILWGLFITYLVYLLIMAKKGNGGDDEEIKNIPLWKALILTVGGMVAIIFGSDFAVDGATGIARALGVSDRIIALTIVALGTSLPELVTSVTAAKKGNADIAIGNIVGSDIFNLLFVIGTASLIVPIGFAKNFIIDGCFALAAVVVLWLCCLKDKALKRWSGAILLALYVVYFVTMIL